MKIKTKILVPSLVSVLMMLLLGIVSFFGIRTLQQTLDTVANKGMQHVAIMTDSSSELLEASVGTYRLFATMANLDEARIGKDTASILAHVDSASQMLAKMEERSDVDEADKEALRTLKEPLTKYRKSVSQAIDMAQSDLASGTGMMQAADKRFSEIHGKMAVLLEDRKKEAAADVAGSVESASLVVKVEIIVFLIGLLAIIAIALVQAGKIVAPLLEAILTAKAIAGGKLDNVIDITGQDETGDLARALSTMQNDLRGVVGEIQSVVDAAAKGDFTQQMDLAGKRGFGLEIGQSFNRLNANLQQQIGGNPADAVEVAARVAAGDLGGSMNVHPDDTQSILAAMARMKGNLTAVIQEVEAMVNAAADGDFSQKMSTDGKQGFSLVLCDLLNRWSDVTEAGLQDVIRVSQAIAEGDLTQKISQDYPGLFAQLKEATNSTVDHLVDAIGRIGDATDSINLAAKEIATGNQDLSSRTEQQASSLEETSSSMEQLNGIVRQNAEHADEANQLARSSNEAALRGGEMVNRVVGTMSEIQASSKKIADIIGVIDTIAFQTNILALNAAVEAARAGEQGRGFAVVATEVRNLAQRSAAAAKEIKMLISDSVDRVDSGAKLVNEAGGAMDEIVVSFKKVADLVIDISHASKEQSGGIDQVSKAVAQMDDVTQMNAAQVEEVAAAAESLEEQARELAQAVAMFKLDSTRRLTLPAPQHGMHMTKPVRPAIEHLPSRQPPPALLKAKPVSKEWTEF